MSVSAPAPRTGRAVRVVVADDHAVVRNGLVRIVEQELGMTVAAAVGTGDEAVAAVVAEPCDVVVLDLEMPNGGLSAIEEIVTRRPGVRVLVYSMHEEREWAVRCLTAGAWGFVSKRSELSALSHALVTVGEGRRYVSAEMAEQLIERAIGPARETRAHAHERLSVREFEVFERLAQGHGTVAISQALGLSPKTVSTYRTRILDKLGAQRNADLTRYAIRHGLLQV